MPEYVSMKELGRRLGPDSSSARKFVVKNGYESFRQRTPDSGNQRALVVTAEDAEAIVKARAEEGFLASEHNGVPSEHGVSYAIQVVPDLDPHRVKLGFASTITERLAQHRTIAPTASVLKTWPSHRAWEQAAMDSLTRGWHVIGGEVYECSDLDELRDRGDAFFALMPILGGEDSGTE